MRGQVELDRLADYAAGLLDGTPDGDQVAHLIETDPGWARAYSDLLTADRLVSADLAALGTDPEPMPADVMARLTDRLDAEAAADRTVVSLAARRRRKRWTTVAAAAAGVAVCGALGVPVLRSAFDGGSTFPTMSRDSAGEGQAGAPAAPAPPAPAESGLIVLASGRNYPRDTPWASIAGEPQAGTADELARKDATSIPPDLVRLYGAGARQDCLTAIITVYGGRPHSVDYARFEGAPALMVVLVDERAKPIRMVAAGPGCGLGGDPDVRHTVPIA